MTKAPHASQPILRAGIRIPEAHAVLILLHGRGGSAADSFHMGFDGILRAFRIALSSKRSPSECRRTLCAHNHGNSGVGLARPWGLLSRCSAVRRLIRLPR